MVIKPVVILIPGWGSRNGIEFAQSAIKGDLSMCGFDIEEFKPKKWGFGPIEPYARALAERTTYYKEIGREVHLIGYSMGGLVAVESERYVNGIPNSITTLGTPHAGAILARLSKGSTSARQMRPGSSLLQRTSQKTVSPLFSIACRFDGIVWPLGSSIHPHSVRTMWANHSHVSVLFSHKVARNIIEFLVSNTTNNQKE